MPDEEAGRSVQELEARTTLARFDLWGQIVQTIRVPLTVGSFGIPAWALQYSVLPLAGQETELAVVFDIAVAVSVGVGIAAGGLLWKLRRQSKELQRLRARLAELEAKLGECQEELAAVTSPEGEDPR